MTKIKQTILKYDLDDDLPLYYGHLLRGFFANRFKDVLFHNHKDNNKYRYAYPLIQYKIVDGNPLIVGINQGAELIVKNFFNVNELILGDKKYSNLNGNITVEDKEIKVVNNHLKYELYSPWLGLNQRNYQKYINKIKNSGVEKKNKFFKRILIGNILTFAKGIDWHVDKRIEIKSDLKEVDVNFKNEDMLAFVGEVYSNVLLPEYIGLGKSVARGFGTIVTKRIKS